MDDFHFGMPNDDLSAALALAAKLSREVNTAEEIAPHVVYDGSIEVNNAPAELNAPAKAKDDLSAALELAAKLGREVKDHTIDPPRVVYDGSIEVNN